MATTPNTNVSKPSRELANAFRSDMFGRTKISEAFTIFDSSHRYQDNGDYSDTTSGTSTVTYKINESSVFLNIGNQAGDEVTRESRKVFPYQPGKSLQTMSTFVMAGAKEGLRQRVGYFSRTNGFFLEQDGLEVFLVKRSFISGEVVDTKVPQSEWNTDTLDKSGPSAVELDLSKAQILFTEIEWLGVGSARIGFAIDGYFIVAHQFNHANHIDSVYMTTASLPVRYEVTNTADTEGSSTMKQICVSVISNGGYFKPLQLWTAIRQTATFSTSYYPLISIRLASGRTDSVVIPDAINILPTAAGDYEYVLLRNATVVGGSWDLKDGKNNVEYNISATGLTGGSEILQGFFSSTNQSASVETLTDVKNFSFQLGRTNASSPVSDTVTLAIRTTSRSGSCKSSMAWFDLI